MLAMHRRPVGVRTPPELLEFRAEDWPGSDDESWYPAFRRWCDVRRVYGKAHPDSDLGDPLDQIRFEWVTHRDWMRWRPLESLLGGVHVSAGVVKRGIFDPVSGVLRGRLPGEENIPVGGVGVRYCDWVGPIGIRH
jgi:hypothetical protein